MEEDIKTLLKNLKTEKEKWIDKIYGVGETRIDLMIDDVIKALENLIKGYRDLEEKNKLINVRIKTKLRIAQGNYERYEKKGEHRLALIQCGKVGVLQELMEDK